MEPRAITPVTFRYLNHRGEWSERRVIPIAIEFNKNPGFNYQPGWFLRGLCTDKGAVRSFALSRIDVGDNKFFDLRLDT